MFPTYNLDRLIGRAKAQLAAAGLDMGRLNVYHLVNRLRRDELREAQSARTISTERPTVTQELLRDNIPRTPRPPAAAQADIP